MAAIFLSYRRDDSAPYAGRLYDRLAKEFPEDQIFLDIDAIEPGEDFVEVINARLDVCSATIVLIGERWTAAQDRNGRRRLDNPDDYVRKELATALARGVRVIPVLVGNAQMPRSVDLPEDIRALSTKLAIEVSDTRFHADVSRLVEALRKAISKSVDRDTKPPDPPSPKPRSNWIRWAGMAAGAGLIAAALLASQIVGRIAVPDVVGKPAQDARAVLSAAGLRVISERTQEDAKAAPEAVMAQTPVAGTRVRSEQAIDLVLAAPPRIDVPNIAGKSREQAESMLTALGLALGSFESKETPDQPAGTVIGQNPQAGSRVAKGSAVQVVIAAPPTVLLPDLLGLSIDQARRALTAAGLHLGQVEYRKTADVAAGTVLEQRPRPHGRLASGGKVGLVVAMRPDADVPSLGGMRLSQARAALQKVGLELGKVTPAGPHTREDTDEPLVRSQSLASHTQVKPGSKVNVVVAPPGARVPDVTQMPLERAKARLEEARLRVGTLSDRFDATSPPGVVLAQAASPGALVARDAAVDLTIAKRPVASPKTLRWLTLPGRLTGSTDPAVRAKAECPALCKQEGGGWTGKSGYKDTITCGCEF